MKNLGCICFVLLIMNLSAVYAQDESQNYIRTRKMLTVDGTECLDDIQYFDGLGQAFQSIQKGVTPSHKNLVTLHEFDVMGRDSVSWLSTPTSLDYVDATTLKNNASSFYSDNRPYSQQVYECSPLNRLTHVYGAGAEWSTHPRETVYLANSVVGNLVCMLYKVDIDGHLTCQGKYPSKSLRVTQDSDEDGHIVYTFIDKLGRKILIRQMESGEFHDTYYVYDDFGNKRYVLPPMITLPDTSLLNKYAYYYQYDSRHRCIRKKLPGCDTIRYVYDKTDHLIFTQDGNQHKAGKWTFQFYDALEREVVKGVCSGSPTNVSKKAIVLERTSDSGFENLGYTLPPNLGVTYESFLQVNYYDDYTFLSTSRFTASKEFLSYKARPGYDEKYTAEIASVSAKGQLTGKLVATFPIGPNNSMLGHAFYYDYKGNIIQQCNCNHLGKYDNDFYVYSFTGKVLRHLHSHAALRQRPLNETYIYDYDHADRLKEVTHEFLNSRPIVLYENSYNELGQLQKKALCNNMENISHTYDIHGQLRSLISPHFKESIGLYGCYNGNISSITWTSGNETFKRTYEFLYDDLSRLIRADYKQNNVHTSNFMASYSYDKMGNISSLYRYGLVMKPDIYAPMDRLSITYNGNQLKRVTDNGGDPLYSGAYNFVDGADLLIEYVYDENGNLTQDYNKGIACIQYNLLNLPDTLQFANGNSICYAYGADGVKHSVVHQTAIPNLTVPMGSTLNLMTNQISNTSTVDYCGNVIYKNGVLDMLLTETGYIEIRGTGYSYHHYLRDHQGNNRVVIDNDGNVEQVNHYYPYGGLFGDGTEGDGQPYRYNGKEMDRMHGLDWVDYGSRMKGDLGFTTVDPLCEKYYSISPYAYCANNPIRYVDPDGEKIVIWYQNGSGKQAYFVFDGQNGAAAPNDRFVGSVITAYDYNVQNGGGSYLKNAATSNEFNIKVTETPYANKYQGKAVRFNPAAGLRLKDGHIISPATGLEHEAAHAVKDKTGKSDSTRDSQYDTREERLIITGTELETAKANGELPKNHKGRRSHAEGTWVVTKSVISNKELDKGSSEDLRKNINDFNNKWTSQ